MKKLTAGLIAAAALTAFAGQAQAQTVVGPYLAYHGDFDLGVGGFVTIPIPSIHENISFKGDFGYYFPDEGGFGGVDLSYWELNADALMGFPLEGNESIRPFAFAGLNVARVSLDDDIDVPGVDFEYDASATEVGLNLGGGISFINVGSVRPSVGAKIELGGGEGFVLFGAIGFPVGGGEM